MPSLMADLEADCVKIEDLLDRHGAVELLDMVADALHVQSEMSSCAHAKLAGHLARRLEEVTLRVIAE